jgi:hypothetical protein
MQAMLAPASLEFLRWMVRKNSKAKLPGIDRLALVNSSIA